MKTKFLLLFMTLGINTSLLLAQTMGGGDGSQANPYKISNTADWTAFRTAVSGSSTVNWPYCELANDIDMSTLTNYNLMIGQGTYPFRGVFDGKGHKISNLKIGTSTTPFSSNTAGLFAGINGATLKNLEINVAFYAGITTNPGYTSAGGLVAIADLASTIQDCKITGIIYMTNSGAASKANGLRVGGVVGMVSSASAVVTIINCVTDLDIRVISATTTTASYYGTTTCGGILGDNANNSIIYIVNCNVNGSVYAQSNYSAPLVGGIMGQRGSGSSTACQVYNCLTTNTVEGYNNSTTTTLGCYVGGIAGNLAQNSAAMQIKNCITLNPSIKSFTATSIAPNVNRISAKSQYSVLDANYAKSDMSVISYTGSTDGSVSTGTPVTITINNIATDINGANLGTDPAAEANSRLNTYVSTNSTFNGITLTSWDPVTPGVPTDVIATAGNTQASIAFTAPVYNGGSAIIDYMVTSIPDGFTATGTSSPLTVIGLSNGTAYTFTVKARNTVGSSSTSLGSTQVIPDVTANNINVSLTTNISALTLTPVSDVVVTSNELTINEPIVLNSISVAPGAGLELSSGNTLTAGRVILQSDATGTATLVDNTTSNPQAITATVQQYVEAGRNWYMSIPLASGATTLLSRGTSVVCYDEPSGNWIAPVDGTLNKMCGYIQVATSTPSVTGTTGTVDFTGVINTGAQSISLTRTAGKTGFNLVGNPYPSYLDWNAVAKTNVSNTLWYRTKEGSVYKFYTYVANSGAGVGSPATVTNKIPPMQAFWVRVNTEGTGSIAVDNTIRSHNDVVGNFMKAPKQSTQQLLRLQVSNGTNTDETVLYFNTNASDAFDSYDAQKRSNDEPNIPEIFTQAGIDKLVINGMNQIKYNTEIPIGFGTDQANNFSISANEISNFEAGTRVFLLDKQTPIAETELTNGAVYNFSAPITVSTTGRFSLLFRAPNSRTDLKSTEKLNAQVFVNAANQIIVVSPEKSKVSIYSVMGQKQYDSMLTSTNTTIDKAFGAGIYFVQLLVNGKYEIQKVIIR